jgi:hypothetical protein
MRPEEILYGEANSLWLILTAVYVFRGPSLARLTEYPLS